MIRILDKVIEREHEHPHEVDKVPVQTHLLYHLVMTSSVVHARNSVYIDEEVQQHTTEHVKAVEACDEKEEVSKILRTILVHMKVSAIDFDLIPDAGAR